MVIVMAVIKRIWLILVLFFPLITNAQYNFQLVGGRASVSFPNGKMVGLNQNSIVGYYLNGNNYVWTNELTIEAPFTQIVVSGSSATSKDDAVSKINALIVSASTGSSSGGGGTSTTPVTPVTKITSYQNVTSSGTIATGSSFISIINIGSVSGTVKGVILPAGTSITFPATYGELNDAVIYDATGTNFLIATRR